LTKGDIGTFDGQILLSNLGHVATCKPSAGSCSVEDGIIVWDDKIHAPCAYKPGEWYEVKKTDLHFIIPKIQGALTRVHNRTVNAAKSCLPPHFILTDQGVVLVPKDKYHLFKLAPDLIVPDAKDPKFAALLSLPKSRQVRQKPPNNNTTVDPTNMRLQYLEAIIEHIRINEFRDVWLNLCHLAATQLKLVWQFLRLDPTTGARALLNRNDIFARFAGNALMVWRCTPVNVTKVFWDYKVDKECFAFLPVQDSNGVMRFALPGNIDLVSESPKIPCNQVISGIFFDPKSETWNNLQGTVHVHNLSLELIWKDHAPKIIFDAPPIMTPQASVLTSTLAMLQGVMLNFERLDMRFNHFVDNSNHLSLDPEILQRSMRNIQNGAKSLVNYETSHFEPLLQILSFFRSGKIQTFLNIFVTTIAIIGLCYCIWTLYPCIRACIIVLKCCCFCCKPKIRRQQQISPEIELQHLNNPENPQRRRYAYTVGIAGQPTVCIILEHLPCVALIDTGASISLVSDRVVNSIDSAKKINLTDSSSNAMSLTGHDIHTTGKITLALQFGQFRSEFEFYIMPDCPHSVVLGIDVLKKFGNGKIEIDFIQRWISTETDTLPFVTFSTNCQETQMIVNSSTVVVPAKTLLFLEVNREPNSEPTSGNKIF